MSILVAMLLLAFSADVTCLVSRVFAYVRKALGIKGMAPIYQSLPQASLYSLRAMYCCCRRAAELWSSRYDLPLPRFCYPSSETLQQGGGSRDNFRVRGSSRHRIASGIEYELNSEGIV